MTTKSRSKTPTKTKKPTNTPILNNEESEQDQDLDVKPGKITKPIEIDEVEPPVAIDDKMEEDPLAVLAEEDDSVEEIGLDGEEINPFGDRWEE